MDADTCVWMLLLASTLPAVAALSVEIAPSLMHVITARAQVTITCTADAPLTECNFKWREFSGAESRLLDVGPVGGSRCVVTLSLDESFKLRVVGCRVRGKQGGWRYATMTMHHAQGRKPITMSAPQSVTVLQGEDTSIMCSANQPLTSCSFMLPTLGHVTVSEKEAPAPGYRYLGSGLENGQCGITLLGVAEDDSGWVWCSLQTASSGLEQQAIPFIVARPLQAPMLQISKDSLTEGSTLEAMCRVMDTRPAATMTWLLDDQVIRQDDEDDVPSSSWRWPVDSQQLTQKLTRQLVWQDHGRQLVCQARHTGVFSSKVSVNKTLHVEYMPRASANQTQSFWFEVGKPAVVTLELYANPRPDVKWVVMNGLAGEEIEEGDSDYTGRLESAILEGQGPGKWVARLYFNNLSWADLQLAQNSFLRMSNHLGGRHVRLQVLRVSSLASVQGPPVLIFWFSPDTGMLESSCQIRSTRRVGSFRWQLGPDWLKDGLRRPQVSHTDSEGVHTVMQNFTRQATWVDDGKQLTCWAAGSSVTISLVIRHAPHLLLDRLTQMPQTLRLGEPKVIPIYWSANPRPSVTWWVDKVNNTGTSRLIMEAEVLLEGGSTWLAQLLVVNVSEDYLTDLTVHVLAYNEIGNSEPHALTLTLADLQTTDGGWQSIASNPDNAERYTVDYRFSTMISSPDHQVNGFLEAFSNGSLPASTPTVRVALSESGHTVTMDNPGLPSRADAALTRLDINQGVDVNMYLLVFSILSAAFILVSNTVLIYTWTAHRCCFTPKQTDPGSKNCSQLLSITHTESFPKPPPDTIELTSLDLTNTQVFPPPPVEWKQLSLLPDMEDFSFPTSTLTLACNCHTEMEGFSFPHPASTLATNW